MPAIPQLTFEEARVFGCLIEKSQATPEYYPLTLNAVMNACNQKSSREPVADFDEDTVEIALDGLREKGLVAYASGTGRALKYMHRAGHNGLGLTPAEAAAMSLILLRGPQTAGEIKARAGRQFNYPSIEFVQETLTHLASHEKNLLEEAPRRSGQKEVRYRHMFFSWPEETGTVDIPQSATEQSPRERLQRLEDRLTLAETQNKVLAERLEELAQKVEWLTRELS